MEEATLSKIKAKRGDSGEKNSSVKKRITCASLSFTGGMQVYLNQLCIYFRVIEW
jgi:hypothetical protein